MFYQEWGFKDNPFNTLALPGSELGRKLLVGRQSEVKALKRRLESPSKIPTLEGLNGSGKTSLVNVLLFSLYKEVRKTNIGPLFIPCRKIFQIDESVEPSDFRQRVLLEVAQTLIEEHGRLHPQPGLTRISSQTALKRFLNSPHANSLNAAIGYLGGGLNRETNTGFGFEKSGFEKLLFDWLEEIFPTNTSGAVVCILDNLELLQTSETARITVERLRDTLFSIRGIKWVLCGSLGIVHGIASSPRLDGRLHKPVVVDDLTSRFAHEIFSSRVKAYRDRLSASLPLNEANFVELFDMMRGNIRSALSEADDFCNWVADRAEDPEDFTESFFEEWMEQELELAYNAIRNEIRPRALEVFETACQFEIFSPSDCKGFGYDTPQAMRPQIKSLEEVGLLRSSIDDSDKRRKTIQVTSKGWKVRAYLDYFGSDA